jgi:hypothetical protein
MSWQYLKQRRHITLKGSAGKWANIGGGVSGDVIGKGGEGSDAGSADDVMVLEGHCWRWRRRFGEFVAVVCVGNREKIVTSW